MPHWRACPYRAPTFRGHCLPYSRAVHTAHLHRIEVSYRGTQTCIRQVGACLYGMPEFLRKHDYTKDKMSTYSSTRSATNTAFCGRSVAARVLALPCIARYECSRRCSVTSCTTNRAQKTSVHKRHRRGPRASLQCCMAVMPTAMFRAEARPRTAYRDTPCRARGNTGVSAHNAGYIAPK